LFYINDDDAINCTMKIPSTYRKFVFMEFNKKCYNSNLHIQFEYIYKLYDILSIDFVIFYFDVYIYISIDFMFKVETHVQQFENICKPKIKTCVILKMMMP
jgi:hypothetical protein